MRKQILFLLNTAFAFGLAWEIYPAPANAQWWNPFAPSDYEDCAESAARAAKSKEALAILIQSCEAKFSGRRKRGGGYTFFDERQQRLFDISGPNPTTGEMKYIDRQYEDYLQKEAAMEVMRADEERRRQQAYQEQEDANNRLLAALEHRRQSAISSVKVVSGSLDCYLPETSCSHYKFNLKIKNNSKETISRVSVGWVIMPKNETDCPTSFPTRDSSSVTLKKGDTTVLNSSGRDGPDYAAVHWCAEVTDVTIVP